MNLVYVHIQNILSVSKIFGPIQNNFGPIERLQFVKFFFVKYDDPSVQLETQ